MEPEHRHNDDAILTEIRSLKDILNLEIAYLKAQVAELKEQKESLGKRMTVLELWQSNSMGKMAMIFTIIGFGVSFLLSWTIKHIQ